MSRQICQSYDKELISEIAIKAGDSDFRLLSENYYAQAVFRAKREVVRKYNILNRRETVKVASIAIRREKEVGIVNLPKNFSGFISLIDELEREYTLVQEENLFDGEYNCCLVYSDEGGYYQLYVLHTEKDKLFGLQYLAYDQSDEPNESYMYVFPEKYYEEVMKIALLYILDLMLAKASAEPEQRRISLLIKRYSTPKDISKDLNLVEDTQWIEIQPYRYP